MSVVMGTAGHIDHGKTSLVRALTGIDCDRLEEEKRRGITIELGFAWADMPGGERLGIVDVPGHERFVKNMVAGASGVDFVMLVIAADEGVMPQTREHLEICSLLGIRRGFVALTKIDMADAAWLELVTEDVRQFVAGSFLEGAPIFPVSAATGQGMEALRKYLFDSVKKMPARDGTDIFRLPVDRVFTLKGHGTVVTGTVASGAVETGEEVCVQPQGTPSRARSLQCHGAPAEIVRAGRRCAMNLQGVDVDDIRRGDVVCRPGTLFPSRRWLVNLTCLASAPRPLRQRTEVHFHHGTRECAARVRFYDRDRLAPGETCLAELRFSEDMTGLFGDHCVLRAYSPLRTVAGGTAVSVLPPELRARDPRRVEKLALLARLPELADPGYVTEHTASDLVSAALELAGPAGTDVPRLQVLTGLRATPLQKQLQDMASRGNALCWDRESRAWITTPALQRLLDACVARTGQCHTRDPLKPAVSQGAACAGWSAGLPPRLVQKTLELALKKGLLVREGDGLRLPSHKVSLGDDAERLRTILLEAHDRAGMTPPNLKDVLEETGATEKQALPVLRLLCEEKRLVRLKDGLYCSRAAVDAILDRVRAWFSDHDDLDVGGLKTILGLSRKYLIAILEYMDREKITVRIGDKRQYRGR